MKRRRYGRILAMVLGLSLALTACGGSKPEEVTDYGEKSSGKAGAKEDSSGTGSAEGDTGNAAGAEKTSDTTAAKKSSTLPDIQAGGAPLWEDSFARDGKQVKIGIKTLSRDMDSLHSYRLKSVSKDMVYEKEVVKNILGDNAQEVHRDISRKDGDSMYLVEEIRGFRYNLHPEEAGAAGYSEDPVASWEDAGDLYYHTYEGSYMDVPYQLTIFYSGEERSKEISFWPKNPGDLVGVSSVDLAQPIPNHIEGINTEIWSGTNVWEAMKDRPNRTQGDEDTLKEAVRSFAEDKLKTPILAEDLKLTIGKGMGDPVKQEVLFFNEEDAYSGNLDEAVLDGYEVIYDMDHAYQSVEQNLTWLYGNDGRFAVTDRGVTGGYIRYRMEAEEQLADQVQILAFDNLMEAFREVIKTDFEMSKVNGQELSFDTAILGYYPISSEEHPGEYTLIPVWILPATSNGIVAYVLVNAVDGSMVEIIYTI